MSSPDPSREYGENERPSDSPHKDVGGVGKKLKKMAKKVRRTGTHEHSHNEGGLVGALKGLQNTKHFGVKRRARHKDAQKHKDNKNHF